MIACRNKQYGGASTSHRWSGQLLLLLLIGGRRRRGRRGSSSHRPTGAHPLSRGLLPTIHRTPMKRTVRRGTKCIRPSGWRRPSPRGRRAVGAPLGQLLLSQPGKFTNAFLRATGPSDATANDHHAVVEAPWWRHLITNQRTVSYTADTAKLVGAFIGT